MMDTAKALWIWDRGEPVPHHFSQFRRVFHAPGGMTTIRIAVESDWALYCDGAEILRGQFQDYPDCRRYSEIGLVLTPGEHLLAVAAYFCGGDFQTAVAAATPGLWCEIIFADGGCCVSDARFRARRDRALLRDRLDRVNGQLGMVFGYDARESDKWREVDYDDSHWESAMPTLVQFGTPTLRPVPVLRRLPVMTPRVVREFSLRREAGDPARSYAQIMDADIRVDRAEAAHGRALIYDLGSEELGFVELELRAAAGTVIDWAHGEHAGDGRVCARVGERNFADRYIAAGVAKGERYTLFRRVGARYLELHVIGGYEKIAVHFHPVRLPLPEAAAISGNAEDEKLWRASVLTLELCMAEHYMDCPWREQALYGYDSRFQMLFGYGLWGNEEYVRANLALLCRSVLDNGLCAICAPSVLPPQIPLFSLILTVAAAELRRFSRDGQGGDENRAALARIRAVLLANRDEKSGLYRTPAVKGAWNFYEWSDGLDGLNASGDCTDFSHLDGTPQLEAPYNLYLMEFFGALADCTGDEAYRRERDALREALRRYFFDPENRRLRTRDKDSRIHEAVQALALYHGVVPEAHREAVWRGVMANRYIPATLSSLFYLVEAAMNEHGALREELADYIADRLRRTMLPMLAGDHGGTLWETVKGGADFDGAGSLCHGWSAIFVWFYQRYILGVREFADGDIRVAPRPCGRTRAAGEVRTALGVVAVEWRLDASGRHGACTIRKNKNMAVHGENPPFANAVFEFKIINIE